MIIDGEVTGQSLMAALKLRGYNVPTNVSRIVIDIRADDCVRVFYETYMQAGNWDVMQNTILNSFPPLKEAKNAAENEIDKRTINDTIKKENNETGNGGCI